MPVYPHISVRDESRVINLTAPLGIRNTDAEFSIADAAVRPDGSRGGVGRPRARP